MSAARGAAGGKDVVVIGGGVIGLAVAWRAARAGLDVAVADPDPGRGASWAAAGMLAPVTEVHYGEEALLRLSMESSRCYPAFVAELENETGADTGYRRSGTLVVARDTDDNAALDDLFAFQQRLGLAVERLSSRDCRTCEPALATGVRGGILVPGDHQIDNRALVRALLTAVERAGVRVHRQRVTRIGCDGDRVRAAVLADGTELGAGQVVLAAGSWSPAIEVPGLPDHLGGRPPVRPVKGQLLHLRPRAGGVGQERLATHNIRGLDVYVVPRADGRVVVGATVEEQGYDVTATAGAVYTLLRDAYELLPDLLELELTEVAVGLRPGSLDNAPLLGRWGPEGLIVATGHYRNGVLLTPVTADGIVALLTGGAAPELLTPFEPGRFAAVLGGRP